MRMHSKPYSHTPMRCPYPSQAKPDDFATFGKFEIIVHSGGNQKTRFCGHLNSRLMRIRSQVLVPNWLSYYVGEREWDTEE